MSVEIRYYFMFLELASQASADQIIIEPVRRVSFEFPREIAYNLLQRSQL